MGKVAHISTTESTSVEEISALKQELVKKFYKELPPGHILSPRALTKYGINLTMQLYERVKRETGAGKAFDVSTALAGDREVGEAGGLGKRDRAVVAVREESSEKRSKASATSCSPLPAPRCLS